MAKQKRYVCHICKAKLPLVNGKPEYWRCEPCRKVVAMIDAALHLGEQPTGPEREARIAEYERRAELNLPLFD